MRIRARLRRWCDGIGGYLAIAGICLVFCGLGVAIEAQDPSHLRWTGHKVTGFSEGGIVYYTYHGQNYSVDSPSLKVNSPRKQQTVYVDPGDPYQAWLYTRQDAALTALYVGLPFTLAVGVVGFGVLRRSLRTRERLRLAALPRDQTFGEGLDEGYVLRALANMRKRSLHRE